MALRINHNIAAISAHRNLLNTDAATSKSLQRLSSGMKINSAADAPASLVISEQMRAQIASLNQAVNNTETAVSLVQTAEGALNEVNKLMVSMRQLAIHAANEGANDNIMLEADQAELVNALDTIDRIAQHTQFGTKKIIDGSKGANGVANGDMLEFVQASPETRQSPVSGYRVNVEQVSTQASKLSGAFTQEMIDAGERITISEGGKSMIFETEAGMSLRSVVENMNIESTRAGLDIRFEQTPDDRVYISHNQFGSKYGFLVASTSTGLFSEEPDVTVKSDAGMDIKGTINGEESRGEGQLLTGKRGTNVQGLSVRYRGEEPLEGPDTDVGTVTVAQNSLVFQVGANEGQTVNLSLKGVATDLLGKGLQNKSAYDSLSDLDLRTSQGAQDAMLIIDRSIDEVSSMRADLGAFQKNTLESNLANLRIASENMISSESVIRDTDMAAEMATLTRNQIMNKAGSAMLAQANQVSQNVLSLMA